MANQGQMKILGDGVTGWKHWRKLNPYIEPDLVGADLLHAQLGGADFKGANLYRTFGGICHTLLHSG